MKDSRIIIILSLLLSGLVVQGQQLPVYDLYLMQGNMYNPAYAGTDIDGRLSFDFKKEHNQIDGGAVVGWIGFDMPVRHTNIGLAGNFSIDNVGARDNISGSLSYAYHIHFSKDTLHSLSIGLNAGFYHQRFRTIELMPLEPDDPAVLNLNNNGATAFDMNAGLNYRYRAFFIGASAPQMLDSKLSFRKGGNKDLNSSLNHLRRHYFVHTGYEFTLDSAQTFFLEPSVMMRATKGLPVQFDVNLMFDWSRKVWLGVSYKSANGFAKTASFTTISGFNIKERLDVTYGFGMDLNETLREDFGFGHEVMLTLKFGKRFREIEKRLDDAEEAIKRNALAIEGNTQAIDSLSEEMNNVKDQVNTNTENIAENSGDIEEINENITNIFNTVEELMEKSNVMYKKIGSVYFKVDSDRLTDEAKAKLDAFKDALRTPENEFFIYVAGNASEEAPNDYNMLLSTRRAASVKKYLESIGVGGHIFILSYGEEAPVVTPQRTEEQRSQNRRVDIFISGK